MRGNGPPRRHPSTLALCRSSLSPGGLRASPGGPLRACPRAAALLVILAATGAGAQEAAPPALPPSTPALAPPTSPPAPAAPTASTTPPPSAPSGPLAADLERWLTNLGADRYEARERATESLLEAGDAAVPYLERALASPDPEVRFRARFLLGAERRRVESLLRAIRRIPGRGASAAAVDDSAWNALVGLGPRAVPPLLDAVRQSMDVGDRRRAGIALRAIEALGGKEAETGLVALCEHDAFPVYVHVIAPALAAASPEGGALAGAIAPLTRHRNERVRRHAIELCGALGRKPALADLAARGLADTSPEVRSAAIDAVVATGGSGSVPLLLGLLDDQSPEIQARIIQALGAFEATDAAPKLRRFLALPDAAGHDPRLFAAIGALGALRDRESVPRLLELAGVQATGTAALAIEALGAIGAKDAVPGLVALLDKPSTEHEEGRPQRERELLRALERIGDPTAAPAVAAYLARGGELRAQALQCLGEMRTPEAGQALLERFRGGEGPEASYALSALVVHGDPALLGEAALAGVSKADTSVRTTSAQLLGRWKPEGAFEALKRLAEDEAQPYQVHYRTLEALGELKDERGIEVLRGLLGRSAVRRDAARALSRLGVSDALSEEVEGDLERLTGRGVESLDGRNALGIDLTYLGRFEEAEAQFKVMLDADPSNNVALYNLGCVAALAGQPERAIDFLRQSFEKGYSDWRHMELDRDLDSLRTLAGYKSLLGDMKHGRKGSGGRGRIGGLELLDEEDLLDGFGVGGGATRLRFRSGGIRIRMGDGTEVVVPDLGEGGGGILIPDDELTPMLFDDDVPTIIEEEE